MAHSPKQLLGIESRLGITHFVIPSQCFVEWEFNCIRSTSYVLPLTLARIVRALALLSCMCRHSPFPYIVNTNTLFRVA